MVTGLHEILVTLGTVTERSRCAVSIAAMESADIEVQTLPADKRFMRIALVTETYPPEVNGVAMTLARLVDGLHARHHDLQLIRPRQKNEVGAAPRMHEVLLRGLPIPRYPNLRMGVPSKRALVKLWSTQRPDVVHIATEGPLGWSALQAARHLRLPVTSDFRTNFHAYSAHYGIGWLHKPIMAYLRKFHNHTQCTMVPTAALRADLEAAGFQRLVVVSRGVDAQAFSPAFRSAALRASWGVPDDALVVACVGRLAAEKNLELLLSSFEAIRQQQPQARLLLVGEGPLRATLQTRCPDAIFAGQQRGADLAAHYASADLFVFASQTETFGNVTTEAMASGLPVLAYRHAGAAQLILDGENGRLASLGDAATFTRLAVQLANDPAQRQRLGAAARQTALANDWDSICARFESELFRAAAWPQAGAPALTHQWA
jgi:glycosyltransferase involved in cell wall biosynthesis